MLLFSTVGSKIVTFLPPYWQRNKRGSVLRKRNEVLL